MYIYIRSMSEAQSKVYDKLTSHSEELVKHIMKLILFPLGPAAHWKGEIYSFVNSCPKLKGKNKLPSSKFIFNCLSVSNDILVNLMRQVLADESELSPSNISPSVLLQAAETYERWLADMLAQYGAVTRNEVYAELDSIIESTFD